MSFSREAVAFVLDGDVSGLGVIRSLGRENVPLKVIDHDTPPGLSSRYGKGIRSPNPKDEPEGALNLLLKEGEKLDDKGVLFPGSDLWVEFISKNRKELLGYFNLILPSEQVSKSLTNKRFQYDEAQRLGIQIARTFYPNDRKDIDVLKNELEYPVFIKPYSGHLWRCHFPNKGFQVDSSQQLTLLFDKIFTTGLTAMVQEIVVGPNTNHFEVCAYISRTGEVIGPFVAQKIRQYPNDFGMGTFLKSVHNREVAELGTDLLAGMRYRGIADIEFKRDERDGKFKMLDMNSRYWFQTIQATSAGINFPLIQYQDLTDQELSSVTDYRDDVTWLNAPSDLLSIIKRPGPGRTDWNGLLKSWIMADCYSYFAWDDLGPAMSRMLSKNTISNMFFHIR
jgi:D-aspartate ligase